jgi:RNA polymerase sigma-70 factor (ECF subfamily)
MTAAMTEPNRIQTLVEQAQKGRREAFDELVRESLPRLRAAIHRLLRAGGADLEVDEIVQETLVLAFAALPRFAWQDEAAFYGWLVRIARNAFVDRLRSSSCGRYLELPASLPAPGPSPSRAMRRGERLERLESALSALPPDYSQVLRLSQLERLKVKEIAGRMGRSEYAVKHLMARAVRKLREVFGDTESLHLPGRLDAPGGHHGEG